MAHGRTLGIESKVRTACLSMGPHKWRSRNLQTQGQVCVRACMCGLVRMHVCVGGSSEEALPSLLVSFLI